MTKIQDTYVNRAYSRVTMSGANVLTFSEIQTGMAMFEKVAWIIHRIEWFPFLTSLQELAATSDDITMALVGNDNMTGLVLGDQAVYDILTLGINLVGAVVSHIILEEPIIRDFSNLPGQGLIIPPRPLYVAMMTNGFVAAGSVDCRIYFTYKSLKADEYWELVEATRIIE